MTKNDFAQLKALGEHRKSVGTAKPLESDFFIGWGKESVAVFIRHTSEIMFQITPFEKDGDDYFKLTQFGEDAKVAGEMYLCIGELDGLQELLTRVRQIMAERGTA